MISKNNRTTFAAFILLGIVLAITFVFAAHIITTSTGGSSYSVDEDVESVYNITVNNTDAIGNITEVNITIPATFTFTDGSNATDGASHTFTNTTLLLSWINDTAIGLVENGTNKSFSFNLTASTPGDYNLTITTTNGTGSFTTNISVTVNDTIAPSWIDFISPTPAANANLSQSYIPANISVNDSDSNISIIRIYLYNSTGLVNNTNVSAVGGLNATGFINFSSTTLPDGVYYLNATANDTAGNENITGPTRTITLDTTGPLIDYGTGVEVDNANVSQSNIYVNVSVTETNEKNITFLLHNSTGLVNTTNYTTAVRTINWTSLPDGVYTYNVTVVDDSGASNTTTTRTITLDTTVPVVTFSCDSASMLTNVVLTCSCSGAAGGSGINTTSYTVNPSTSYEGSYTTTCTVTDYAGNSAVSSFAYEVTDSSGSGSGSGSAGTPSYSPSSKELSEGYNKAMYRNWKVSFKVGGSSHTFKVEDVTATSAKISVSSVLQEATLSVGQTKKFDVTGNGYYDLQVTLNSIKPGTLNKADLTLKTINEQIVAPKVAASTEPSVTSEEAAGSPTPITGDAIGGEGKMSTWTWIIIIGLIVIVAIIIVMFKKKRRVKGRR